MSTLVGSWRAFYIFPCRLVIAELQHIVYSEYLPTILAPSGMQLSGAYRGYDPDVNPTIANAFATAAYRFGHGQILPFFQRLNESYLPRPEGPLQLRHAFFAPYRLLEEGGIDPLLRGLLASPGKKRAPYSGINSNLTEALFEQVCPLTFSLPRHACISGRLMTWVWIWQLSTYSEAGTTAYRPTFTGEGSAVCSHLTWWTSKCIHFHYCRSVDQQPSY